MRLSKRLQTVAGQVQSGGVVADIGCDHGWTSIYMVQKGIARGAIAMDIREGPLERARQHIIRYHMQEVIETRLSDGAAKLQPGEADTLLMSGMGGALICRILKDSPQVVQSAAELVLSPQSEPHLVRSFLLENGFAIDREEMLLDQGKYYVVIHGVPGHQHFHRQEEYLFGRYLIQQGDRCLQEYLEKEQYRVKKILKTMDDSTLSPSGVMQKNRLEEKLGQIQWSLRECEKNWRSWHGKD
jgi:tRNA (adenine22-N1)-methyltransferase